MKIEIGESLAYSWLKHVKRCQIVQLNWKIADEWQKGNWDKLESIVKEAKEFFTASQENADANEEAEASNIFKKNADLSQIIRQAESDILGIHFDGDGKMEVYAVEVAFHSRGLNYTGGKEATKSKIIAKALRSAMGIYSVLGASQAHLCFMSPKVNPATIETMADVEESLNLFFKAFGLDYTFSTYFNNHFSSDIWHPVCQAIANSGANDTSELCARAIYLQQIAEGKVNRDNYRETTHPALPQADDRGMPAQLQNNENAPIQCAADIIQSIIEKLRAGGTIDISEEACKYGRLVCPNYSQCLRQRAHGNLIIKMEFWNAFGFNPFEIKMNTIGTTSDKIRAVLGRGWNPPAPFRMYNRRNNNGAPRAFLNNAYIMLLNEISQRIEKL